MSGTRLSTKYVVIESDDWGSVRIPSQKVLNNFRLDSLGNNPFNRLDCLESSHDLESLFDLLRKFEDHKGKHPVFTADFIVGNPNFEKIREDKFQKYSWESVEQTYDRYHPSHGVLSSVREGIEAGIFHPQFHGREHLNALRWIQLLADDHKKIRDAFDAQMYCIDIEHDLVARDNLMAAFDYRDDESKQFLEAHLQEGMQEFSRLFGYKSKSFIAPCNVWDSFVEQVLKGEGVKYIQSLSMQKIPEQGSNSYKNKRNVLGNSNMFGQIYSVRNVYFEPSTNDDYDWVGNALSKITAAFLWGKPAIISTHRINYVGGIQENNRKQGLDKLSTLLKEILKKWPEVEFITSEQLGDKLAMQ